jgi:DnaJ-class molecular chaperone
MRDPYTVLGVKRDASADEVKRAYRKLAKASHPDRNASDPKAQDRFAELNGAYEILGDEAKRRAFDRGEIDADGKPRATMHPGFEPGSAGGAGPGGFRFDFGGGGPFGGRGGDPRDMFSDIFSKFEQGHANASRQTGGRASPIPSGEDAAIEVAVPLETVVTGGSVRVIVPDGRTIEVTVPKGVSPGKTMRLKGQGHPSPFGGPNGDALVTLRYARHQRFTVEGADLRASVPVPIRDAVLGGEIRVPTLAGEVAMTVPPWSNGGKTMRLRAKGLPQGDKTGDLYITLQIDLGAPDPEVEGFFRRRKG